LRKKSFLKIVTQLQVFAKAIALVVSDYKQGGRNAGNDASVVALHLIAEFVSKLECCKSPLAANALSAYICFLTASGSGFG